LGGSLPADLEQLVLQCLEKDPARRPADAETLRQRLLACDVPPWTLDQARAWWQRCVTGTAARRAAERRHVSSPPTLAVDLAERELELDLERARTTANLGPKFAQTSRGRAEGAA
jgi:hypothetical protein